jgi:uncharacterized protein YggT (Ycf19 family)
MHEDDKLAIDESRRISQHEDVKGQVRDEVHSEIAKRANQIDRREEVEVENLAGGFKQKAISEVYETEAEIERARSISRVSQIVDYFFCIIYGIIGLEIALELFGARDTNSFKRFLDTVSAPLLAPFRGLMPDPGLGGFRLMLSFIVALIVYALIHLAINGLLRLLVQRKRTI